MTASARISKVPFGVRRAIGRYAPAIREEITRAVQDRMTALSATDSRITAEDIGEIAANVIFGGGETDPFMERLCLEAFHSGQTRPLQEYINELERRVAATASGEA